jgi:hypothetical protein
MPLEGHYARQNYALSPREKRFAAWLGAILAIACVATVLVIVLAGGSSHPKRGCIDVTIPSTTGGARYGACGEKAVATCRAAAGRTDAGSVATREACRKAGIRD